MFCENCGTELSENLKFCVKCGQKIILSAGDSAAPLAKPCTPAEGKSAVDLKTAPVQNSAPRGLLSKKHILFVILGAVLAIIIAIVSIKTGISVSHSHSVSRGFEIAERYLSELNYERAVIEFQNILEIEPMNVEAYLGLAEAYVGMGKTNKAIKTLKEGYRLTGDERLKDMIDELEREDEPLFSSSAGSYGDTINSSIETSEPAQNDAAYGSMGFVTIAGTEIDIATTKSLFIVNKAKHDEGNICYGDLESYATGFNAVIYLSTDLTLEEAGELSKLVNLTQLEIDYTGLSIDHVSKITKLTNLRNLKLWGNEINSITPFSKLDNLRTLDLSNNNISDISPLANLTNLTSLDLYNNQISNISSLSKLVNLRTLDLSNNNISDISPLSNLTNLTFLDLGNTQIADITPIAKLTNLTQLTLSDNKISDISSLAKFTNLTFLDLGSNEISDITPLAKLNNLKTLYLDGNNISDSNMEWLKGRLPECDFPG